MRFTRTEDGAGLHLTREGGHGRRRDRACRRRVRAGDHRRPVRAGEGTPATSASSMASIAVDLITAAKLRAAAGNRCLGAYALDRLSGRVVTHAAGAVVLATGGASKTYLYTTNPDTSTGDGIAMAWRAGCRVANLEFVQFHPTCLFHPQAKTFLISEAVRGEGGRLLLPNGRRFMPDHDPRAELASRDIVARAIDYEMKRGGFEFVYLDISHKPAEEILHLFPNIAARCREYGIDITRAARSRSCRPPTTPAAAWSRTSTAPPTCRGCTPSANAPSPACTAPTASRAIRCSNASCSAPRPRRRSSASFPRPRTSRSSLPDWDESRVTDPDEQIVVSHNWDELRRFMWDYVGIVRTNKRLERARAPGDAAAGGNRRVLRQLPRDERPDRAAQSRAGGRADDPQRAAAPREPRAALQSRLSRRPARSRSIRC